MTPDERYRSEIGWIVRVSDRERFPEIILSCSRCGCEIESGYLITAKDRHQPHAARRRFHEECLQDVPTYHQFRAHEVARKLQGKTSGPFSVD